MSKLSFHPHNHLQCQKSAMDAAEQLCISEGERLTPLRRTVLELVWQSHEPIKAYDILSQLSEVHPASAPTTVYRALDFLQALGLVHKIESLNAYLGCCVPGEPHRSIFLICRDCGSVSEEESEVTLDSLNQLSSSSDFKIDHMNLELHGRCGKCVGH